MNQVCQFCGNQSALVHVHGHYQCSVCGTNALPCCDGDNCETNAQLAALLLPDVIEIIEIEKNGHAN